VELKRAPLDLREVVRRTAETFHPLVAARGQRLPLSVPAEPLPMVADPTRLDQVLGNLLRNAVQYSERGGRLEVVAARDGEHAVVRVIDDGIGMSAELLEEVFEPFSQGQQSLDRPAGGLGIGLTLVRKLVELHGGAVRASSDGVGRGSTFAVRLPLAAGSVGQHEVEPEQAVVGGGDGEVVA
jgi:signal transduction histidine kinase